MKKITLPLLALVATLFLASCNGNTPEEPNQGNNDEEITIDPQFRNIIGTWVIDAAILEEYDNGNVTDFADTYDKNYCIVFRGDGTGTEHFTFDNLKDFTYTINAETLTTVMDGATDVYSMEELSDNRLVYYVDKPDQGFKFTYAFKRQQ